MQGEAHSRNRSFQDKLRHAGRRRCQEGSNLSSNQYWLADNEYTVLTIEFPSLERLSDVDLASAQNFVCSWLL